MTKHKTYTMQCQISFDKLALIKLQKIGMDVPAANDELNLLLPHKPKYYSIKDLIKILHIPTRKEVEYLIKKLNLEQAKYRHINSSNEWVYNDNALNLLNLYTRFKAS
ncbi:hypothetical protein [uncultured Gilliamella sp.]|uniref:hypothetical protein n=1 Tax=uncultured Gilliamella sp. TaxID=1193505 RepID=UPI0025DD19B3|nr:hypothetical protein [uncultured Gilliamella sp.]